MDLGLRLSYRHTLSPTRMVQLGGKLGVRGMEVGQSRPAQSGPIRHLALPLFSARRGGAVAVALLTTFHVQEGIWAGHLLGVTASWPPDEHFLYLRRGWPGRLSKNLLAG